MGTDTGCLAMPVGDDLARIEAKLAALEQRLTAAPSGDELARIEAAYREIQRRDGAAWWHARRSALLVLVLAMALVGIGGILAWLALQKSQVQAFVQTVQVTDEGRLVQVGVPVDLFAYQPEDGAWMNMLVEWVRKYRWRGDEDGMVRTRNDWEWLRRHTCGAASVQLTKDEKLLDPYKKGKRTSVDIKAVTKTQTPASYQVIWDEVRADLGMPESKRTMHTGTFTVERLRPRTMAALLDNRLGQCTNGYGIDPRVGS
jgi:type IV secretory pathway TrbF-like protein